MNKLDLFLLKSYFSFKLDLIKLYLNNKENFRT